MAARTVGKFVSRRFSSSSGKILSEEERAAENVYIKRKEQEKLQKLAEKGPNAEGKTAAGATEKPATGSGAPTDVKPGPSTSSASGVSDDKYRNYAVVAGVVTLFGAIGWYVKGTKKTEEVQN